jgi:hypothetical protein
VKMRGRCVTLVLAVVWEGRTYDNRGESLMAACIVYAHQTVDK